VNLTRFEEFISQRKKAVSFLPDVPEDELLLRLVSVAQKTPSLLGLQPTRFVFIKTPQVKEKIIKASWAPSEISSAPLFLAFAGERDVIIPPEDPRKESMELLFSHKPLGFGWLFKALCVPALRFFSPTPDLPAVHKRAWLYKECAMCAMHFMIAADAAGLSYSVIDLFDEGRIKKALHLPRNYVVSYLLAIGYARTSVNEAELLPVSEVISKI
jgi:nitroreductase